ncbi:MAG: hypothetical protein H0U60_05185 [Blastocatellia bacterium]|nr:hypothetical protein [Blastocatellia bacterium]
MKRCSQCEFTFGDEQKFCDFDGTELVAVPQPPAIRVARRNALHSSFPLALVMIVGVLSSALLIGYYDSANQSSVNVSSNSETRGSGATLIPPVQVDTRDQAKTPPERPIGISTQRRISTVRGAPAMPASMIKWPSEKPRLRSSRPGHGPANSQLAAGNTRHRNLNNSLETRNQKRLGASELVQQRHSVARIAKGKCGASRLGCNGAGNNTESMHHAKDSKLVAFLKTTGRLLKRPFTF